MWKGYQNYDHYFWVNPQPPERGMKSWFNETVETGYPIVGNRIRVYNVPACFDIETSSYKKMGIKKATMYLWSFCLNGSTILGRTWGEWLKVMNFLQEHLHTDRTTLIIYVHNLGYEFQFMRGWLDVVDVFAVKERRPIHVTTRGGIEFKCSYILSNYALAYIGAKLLRKYPVEKAVGDLDYSKIRHSATGLTHEEIWYSVKDVQVVSSYIQEKIENEDGITNIPLTNTGYVRRYCREFCFTQFVSNEKLAKKYKARYHERMKSMCITSQCEYDQLHEAFAGGFTHASPLHSGKLCENVGSADLASSYPAVMVMKKFPMGRGIFVGNGDVSDVEFLISRGYCVLFTIKFNGLTPKFIYENYISSSRCTVLSKDAVINNGRVSSASELQITVTEQDWDIIKRCYEWEGDPEVYQIRFYPADYLPRPFILSILHLFENKTSLKGVPGKETEYMVSKNMINSAYGMSVTNIIRDIFEYSTEEGWSKEQGDVYDQLTRYNNSYNRFLFYAWGVWVTAHARHNLWDAIFEFGEDYVYSDTDSIKGLNYESHKTFFSLYNNSIKAQLIRMCKALSIPRGLTQPLDKKGNPHTIGVFEYEGEYKQFKTIGAKRYIYEYQSGEILFTISGVNKHFGVPYLLKEYSNLDPKHYDLIDLAYSNNPNLEEEAEQAMKEFCQIRQRGEVDYSQIFEVFNERLYFPADSTGKQTLTYIDKEFSDVVEDYNGLTHRVFEFSYIHMEPQSYVMSQTDEYIKFLKGYRDASI